MRDERDRAEVADIGISGAVDRRLRRARDACTDVRDAGEGARDLLVRARHIGLRVFGPVGEARHEHALEERFREGALRAVGGSSHNTGRGPAARRARSAETVVRGNPRQRASRFAGHGRRRFSHGRLVADEAGFHVAAKFDAADHLLIVEFIRAACTIRRLNSAGNRPVLAEDLRVDVTP